MEKSELSNNIKEKKSESQNAYKFSYNEGIEDNI